MDENSSVDHSWEEVQRRLNRKQSDFIFESNISDLKFLVAKSISSTAAPVSTTNVVPVKSSAAAISLAQSVVPVKSSAAAISLAQSTASDSVKNDVSASAADSVWHYRFTDKEVKQMVVNQPLNHLQVFI